MPFTTMVSQPIIRADLSPSFSATLLAFISESAIAILSGSVSAVFSSSFEVIISKATPKFSKISFLRGLFDAKIIRKLKNS